MKKELIAVLFSSLYFLLFLVAVYTGFIYLIWLLYSFIPLVFLYLFYDIIYKGTYAGKELKDDEEWGYEDVNRDQLGTWG